MQHQTRWTWTRTAKAAAAVAALVATAAGCAPPPSPNPAFVVTTTADTFDGTCDTTDCSLRDAIAAANALPLVSGAPNRITMPAGTYALNATSPIDILKPIIITGANSTLTTLDITGSTIAAPSGVFDANVPFTLNGIGVVSTNSPAADVLVTCVGHEPRLVGLFNVTTNGLAAAVSACDTNLVNSVVTGPATTLNPFAFSASSSTIVFPSSTITPTRFTLVSSIVTGPSSTDGSTTNATLSLQPPNGLPNIPVNITGSRLVGLGLNLGGATGFITANVLSTSFGLTGPNGPLALTIGTGTTARIVNSTLYGGGSTGALRVQGTLTAESITATTTGPAIARSGDGVANVRRSILSGGTAAACTSPITSLGHNVVVGSSCGTSAATDLSVANEAALALGVLDRWGGGTPSLHRLPAAGSPVLDRIPAGPASDLDCPTDASGGRSIDARGIRRPQGTACDVGSLELEVTAPAT